MPGTYSQILLHVVFSTKDRAPWIAAKVAERLYPYMGGIVRAERGDLYDIGGVEDHVHLYLRWRPDGSISDLMHTVKSRSARYVSRSCRVRMAGGLQRLLGEQVSGRSGEAVYCGASRPS